MCHCRHEDRRPFSKRLIVHGQTTRDVFFSLYHILRQIVSEELAIDGRLEIGNVSDRDVEVLKNRMLEYGVDLYFRREDGKFPGRQPMVGGFLKDHHVFICGEDSYVVIHFDYAIASAEPYHLI